MSSTDLPPKCWIKISSTSSGMGVFRFAPRVSSSFSFVFCSCSDVVGSLSNVVIAASRSAAYGSTSSPSSSHSSSSSLSSSSSSSSSGSYSPSKILPRNTNPSGTGSTSYPSPSISFNATHTSKPTIASIAAYFNWVSSNSPFLSQFDVLTRASFGTRFLSTRVASRAKLHRCSLANFAFASASNSTTPFTSTLKSLINFLASPLALTPAFLTVGSSRNRTSFVGSGFARPSRLARRIITTTQCVFFFFVVVVVSSFRTSSSSSSSRFSTLRSYAS